MMLISTDEAQAMLGLTDDWDGRLPGLVETASALTEEYLNRFLLKQTYTHACPASNHILYLKAYPVQSVASITLDGETFADWDLDKDVGIIVRKSGWPPSWTGYMVSYVGGYDPDAIPSPIRQACALLTLGLHDSIAHTGHQVGSEMIGDYRITYAVDSTHSKGMELLSPAAASLLRPYRRITF